MNQPKDKQLKSILEFNGSWGERTAVLLSKTFGNMKFFCFILLALLVWITWNLNLFPSLKPFDPYPFTMLTMIVSVFSIILSISVLINQNREGKMNSVRQQIEFEVNVHAETEITKVLEMLHDIQKKLGIDMTTDAELEQMKETLDIRQLHQKLSELDENSL
ncbi:MAG: DUF1003 domain-containing protein [Hymenobacter sp.]|nr:MAG: DUF1003 domain-containing protein [Hymenobacter sp.]